MRPALLRPNNLSVAPIFLSYIRHCPPSTPSLLTPHSSLLTPHSSLLTPSLLHSFTPSLLHSFTPSLLHSFTPSLLHSSLLTPHSSLPVSLSPCLPVSVSPCLRVSVSPCLRVSLSPCLPVSKPFPVRNVHTMLTRRLDLLGVSVAFGETLKFSGGLYGEFTWDF
ncbi:hypothetical protein Rcae01_06619 [Novipirellula caenicola]|uniref:Uncharacterized protein n=1 Tax=Novipirellula caenicola TaxID=1536901 RepID=A0ABP9W1Y0_9BACT